MNLVQWIQASRKKFALAKKEDENDGIRDCSEKTRNLNKNKPNHDLFDQPNIRANKPDINPEFLYLQQIDLKKIRDFN